MNYIQQLEWRYAVKKFDANKKVTQQKITNIERATQLATSSYGLQPYQIIRVEDASLREQLVPKSWNQKQVSEASHLYVFCNYTTYSAELIDQYMALRATTLGVAPEDIVGYGNFMKTKIGALSQSDFYNWTQKQVYLALDSLLIACALESVDACPMEGFEPDAYNEILGLTAKGLSATVVCPIGYRSEEDATQHAKKVRKPLEELFQTM